jgi:iron complex outermembrane recepter protein
MRVTFPKSLTFLAAVAVAAAAATVLATTVKAQHASDNPITTADDAYGLTLGLESVGLYNPGLVRGFNPQAAGNVRIDGLYVDSPGGFSNRVVEGSTIRVGVSEIGYAFPAPTGIVDYNLRRADGDTQNATVITSVGPYQGWGVSIDGSLPLIGKTLVLPIGVSTQLNNQTPFGSFPGYTSRATSVGATPLWSPNDRITVRGVIDWQLTNGARTFPLFFTAGDFLPPPIPRGYLGQNWAEGRNVTMNLGGIVSAQLTQAWSLKAGVFHATSDNPVSFADLYTDIQRNGAADHQVVGYPDQKTTSDSGEVRLTDAYTTGAWRHQLIFMARGRDTEARYGGGDLVDEGPTIIGVQVQTLEPDFIYSARTNDHTDLWSVGTAYHVSWDRRAELEAGVQDENYRETVVTPGTPSSEVSANPIRVYGNAAYAPARQWTLYAGYTQGLETSGSAPSQAQNSGAVLPASLTWQVDSGVRYAVTPKLKLIAGLFELEKPYFNLDAEDVDRKLGVQQARGVELSLAGELARGLHVNIGVLDGRVSITGADLAAERVGSVAVGQARVMYVANVNYVLPWWPTASLDASATHFGTSPGTVDNLVYTPAATQMNLGLRYKFTAFGRKSSLRLQIQNLVNTKVWTTAFTPGFFQWPAPRTVFAYLTTDIGR